LIKYRQFQTSIIIEFYCLTFI